jgi:methyl-accepting chemotaxis protein
MAVQFTTHEEFEHWQDGLTTYLDRKFAHVTQQITEERKRTDAKFDALLNVITLQSQQIASQGQQIASQGQQIASLAQIVQQNTDTLTSAIHSLAESVQQNNTLLANMDSNIRVLMSESARHNVRILALIKGTDPAIFAANLEAANEELDEA